MAAALALLGAVSACGRQADAPVADVAPQSLPALHDVSDRYLSYNVEMVEVTGGRFWRAYDDMRSDGRYEQRPPLDLTQPRLRRLAAALGPAYVRVSGSWANATYFADTDTPPETAPAGFDSVLTREQWRGVVDFVQAVDGEIVTSVAASVGARDDEGRWVPDNTEAWIRYSQSIGGQIAAAEFINEPNTVRLIGAGNDYTTAEYGRDFDAFNNWMKATSPDTLVLGPGSVYLTQPMNGLAHVINGPMFVTRDLLRDSTTQPDVFSFHFYGASSDRCKIPFFHRTEAVAQNDGWLSVIDDSIAAYTRLRDEFTPGRSLWLTETAESACGGNRWAATFADTFRFTDQVARAARQGVQVYMHNTLAASDYGMLDEDTFRPRPNYWAAYLWRSFMGARVLDTGDDAARLRVYAHCLRDSTGGVAMLAVNANRGESGSVNVPMAGMAYTLTQGATPDDALLNGEPLTLGEDDALPELNGRAFAQGAVELAPSSITYLVFPDSQNSACQ